MFSYHQKLLEHSVLQTFTVQGGMSGLNRIDFQTCGKVMQLTCLGEVLYFSVQMKFDSAISRGVDQVQPSIFSQP